MSAITFDTLKIVETLESAGIERAHARAVASVVRDSHLAAGTEVATKADLALLRQEMAAQTDKITIRVAGVFIAVLGAIEVFNRVWPAQ